MKRSLIPTAHPISYFASFCFSRGWRQSALTSSVRQQAAAAEPRRGHLGGAAAGKPPRPDVSHVQEGRKVRKGTMMRTAPSNNTEFVMQS